MKRHQHLQHLQLPANDLQGQRQMVPVFGSLSPPRMELRCLAARWLLLMLEKALFFLFLLCNSTFLIYGQILRMKERIGVMVQQGAEGHERSNRRAKKGSREGERCGEVSDPKRWGWGRLPSSFCFLLSYCPCWGKFKGPVEKGTPLPATL